MASSEDTEPLVGSIYSAGISNSYLATKGSSDAVSPIFLPADRSPSPPIPENKTTPGRTAVLFMSRGYMSDAVLLVMEFDGKDRGIAPRLPRQQQLADRLLTIAPWKPIGENRRSITIPYLEGGYIVLQEIHVRVARVVKNRGGKNKVSGVAIDDVIYIMNVMHERQLAVLRALQAAKTMSRDIVDEDGKGEGEGGGEDEGRYDEEKDKGRRPSRTEASEVSCEPGEKAKREDIDGDCWDEWSDDDDDDVGGVEVSIPYVDLYEDLGACISEDPEFSDIVQSLCSAVFQ